jgi:hypothetical protein
MPSPAPSPLTCYPRRYPLFNKEQMSDERSARLGRSFFGRGCAPARRAGAMNTRQPAKASLSTSDKENLNRRAAGVARRAHGRRWVGAT